MEAASRPSLEPLPDLPLEEPVDAPKPPVEAAKPSNGAAAPPAAADTAAKPRDPEQTGLDFVDPEMFLAPGQVPTAIPVVNAAAAEAKREEVTELVLEDPVVDDLLTAPPPPPPVPKPGAAAAESKPAPSSSTPANSSNARESARVPIAKTASLKSAATKLAAASAGSAARPVPKPAAAAPILKAATPPATSRPAVDAPVSKSNGSSSARTDDLTLARTEARALPQAKAEVPAPAKRETPAAKPDAAKPEAAKSDAKTEPLKSASSKADGAKSDIAATVKIEAPSLASWQSARAAASSSAKSASAAPAGKPSVVAAPAAAAATPPAAPAPNVVAPSPPMDRDFIARNQVVERYLSGRLPLKGATEFERFCKDHPDLLDAIGLPERVNAGLRLLEASGQPEPWQEPTRAAWDKPQVTLTLAAAVAVLAVSLALVAGGSAAKSRRLTDLQKQATERALDPATSTREIRVMPSRSGASNAPAITIGGANAQLAELKIDESRSPYHTFRVTIDRIDQGRVAVINNLGKDSNGHLRLALNSSALGPGNYQFTLEGLDWRGDPQPDSWVTIGVAR